MDKIQSIFASPFIALPAFAIAVTVITYLLLPGIFNKLKTRTLGQSQELMRLLDLMFVEIDKPKLTKLLLLLSFGPGIILLLLLWPNVTMGFIIGSIVTVLMWSVPLIVYQKTVGNTMQSIRRSNGGWLDHYGKWGQSRPFQSLQSMERVVDSLPNPIFTRIQSCSLTNSHRSYG
jgi:hypothetical protein